MAGHTHARLLMVAANMSLDILNNVLLNVLMIVIYFIRFLSVRFLCCCHCCCRCCCLPKNLRCRFCCLNCRWLCWYWLLNCYCYYCSCCHCCRLLFFMVYLCWSLNIPRFDSFGWPICRSCVGLSLCRLHTNSLLFSMFLLLVLCFFSMVAISFFFLQIIDNLIYLSGNSGKPHTYDSGIYKGVKTKVQFRIQEGL